jgi:hypothetical protein
MDKYSKKKSDVIHSRCRLISKCNDRKKRVDCSDPIIWPDGHLDLYASMIDPIIACFRFRSTTGALPVDGSQFCSLSLLFTCRANRNLHVFDRSITCWTFSSFNEHKRPMIHHNALACNDHVSFKGFCTSFNSRIRPKFTLVCFVEAIKMKVCDYPSPFDG